MYRKINRRKLWLTRTTIPLFLSWGIGEPTAEDNKKEIAKGAEALYGIYQSFIKAGFSEGQAMTLVLATLSTTLKH